MKTSNTSTAICLSAAAFFSTSLAAAAPAPAGAPLERALELELALARRPELYLVVDTGRRTVEVKVRGVVLASITAEDAAVLHYRRSGGEPAAPGAILPAVLTVTESGLDERRRVVVARELRPYPDGTDGADAEPPDTAAPAAPAAADAPPPARYRAALDGGWELWVGEGRPGPGPLARFAHAVADGWARWRGEAAEPRTVVGLALAPEDARRLHHLVRPGIRLLVR